MALIMDLAPGYIPIIRSGRIPDIQPDKDQHTLIAKSTEDAARILDILKKRGYEVDIKDVERQ